MGLVPRFPNKTAIQDIQGFHDETCKDDPTHFWFLGTGRDLVGTAVLAESDQEVGNKDPRLDATFRKFVRYCSDAGLPKPNITRFSQPPRI